MFLDILQNALYVHTFLFFLLTILLLYSILRAGIFVNTLCKRVSELENAPITRETVEGFIKYIDLAHSFIW